MLFHLSANGSTQTMPTRLVVTASLAALAVLGPAALGALPAASLADDEPAPHRHWELDYQPGEGGEPSQATVTMSELSGEPAAEVTTEFSIFPGPNEDVWDDLEEGEKIGPLANVMGETDTDGQLTLEWTDEADELDELEISVDLYADPGRHDHLQNFSHRITVGEPVEASSVRFEDVRHTTHEAAIYAIASRNVTQGFEDGTFRPNDHVTRGQMATFLLRGVHFELGEGQADFTDVAGTTHAHAINLVAVSGIAGGYEDGTFRPNDDVTRGQMAAFLARAIDLPDADSSDLTDVAGTTHEDAINAVAAAGITGGFPDGTFRPDEPVTRGQMATFLTRATGIR